MAAGAPLTPEDTPLPPGTTIGVIQLDIGEVKVGQDGRLELVLRPSIAEGKTAPTHVTLLQMARLVNEQVRRSCLCDRSGKVIDAKATKLRVRQTLEALNYVIRNLSDRVRIVMQPVTDTASE